MGDILFHFSTDDVALVARHERGERLSPDERSAVALTYELAKINQVFGPRPDAQKSVDGYGVEDGAKL